MVSLVGVYALVLASAILQPISACPDQGQPKPADLSCSAWRATFERLTDAERDLLKKYGVILRGRWVVSPDLVADCAQREGVEDYLRAALAGEVGTSQSSFARHHRGELSRVLKKVWPELGHSPAVPEDGALEQEKWGILKYADLAPDDLSALLRQSLTVEGLSEGFVDFVLARPVRGLEEDLERIALREENAAARLDRTSATEIYCLALLHSMGRKGIAKRLTKLSGSDRTSEIERKVISAILSRIRAKERIRWQDLEALELQT